MQSPCVLVFGDPERAEHRAEGSHTFIQPARAEGTSRAFKGALEFGLESDARMPPVPCRVRGGVKIGHETAHKRGFVAV